MTWNYRIVEYKDGSGYGLHEVFYDGDSDATAWAMAVTPDIGPCDTLSELISTIETMLADSKRRPIFREPEKWAERGNPLEE